MYHLGTEEDGAGQRRSSGALEHTGNAMESQSDSDVVIAGGHHGEREAIHLDKKRDDESPERAESAPVTGSLGHCPTVAGMYKFQAKVQSGSGDYKVGVYAKKQ